MTMIKTQFLLLSFILKTRLKWSLSWRFYCTSDYAKLPRYCCQRWKAFQKTEAYQNLQQVYYDR